MDEMTVIKTLEDTAYSFGSQKFAWRVKDGRFDDSFHNILISTLWGLIDALYVQANARMNERPESDDRWLHGRASVDISWHGLVVVGGYDYGRGDRCLSRFGIQRARFKWR